MGAEPGDEVTFDGERLVQWEADARTRALSRWGPWTVVGLIGVAMMRLGDHPGVALTPLLVLSILALLATRLRQSRAAAWRAVTVVASRAGLRVGNEHVPDVELESAMVEPELDGGPVVRVRRKRAAPLLVRVTDVEDGRRLVRALGLDPTRRLAEMRAPSWVLTRYPRATPFVVAAAAILWALPLFSSSPLFVFARWVLYLASIAVVLWPSRVAVGADGLLIRWLAYRRFIRFADVRDMHVVERRNRRVARIVLRSGEALELLLTTRQGAPRSAALVERIEEGLLAARASAGEFLPYLPARADKPVRQWLEELRGFGMGMATHRTAAADPEALARVVESAAATPKDRAAAAVALAASDGGVPRLRVAAEAVAEPKLRVAIDAVAGGDEAALEEALDELERDARVAAGS